LHAQQQRGQLKTAFDIVRKDALFDSIVDSPDATLVAERGVKATFHFVYPQESALQAIFNSLADGKTKLPEFAVLPVTEAREAHLVSETRRTRGKTVLKIEF
jgi:NADPH:quinone reductase-like Zn-dependent oxidoreductase